MGTSIFLRYGGALAVGLLAFASGVAGADEDSFSATRPSSLGIPPAAAAAGRSAGGGDGDRPRPIRRRARNIADVLRLVPGFSVTRPTRRRRWWPTTACPTRNTRRGTGAGGWAFAVFATVQVGSTEPGSRGAEDIERIEVMRGLTLFPRLRQRLPGSSNIIRPACFGQPPEFHPAASRGNQSTPTRRCAGGGQWPAPPPHDLSPAGRRRPAQHMFGGNLGWFDPTIRATTGFFDLRADVPLGDRDELQLSA